MSKGTVNKVILIGRLGADPDIRYSPNGVAVAKFNLATNDSVSAGEGKWEDRTEWHRIVTFGKTAEFCGNYLAKGRHVFIEGSIRTNQWDDPQGQKRYMTEIVAREIQLLGSAEGQGQGQGQGQAQGTTGERNQAKNAQSAPRRSTVEELPSQQGGPPDDDIPF
jgi:single-strand DNA-binding protein